MFASPSCGPRRPFIAASPAQCPARLILSLAVGTILLVPLSAIAATDNTLPVVPATDTSSAAPAVATDNATSTNPTELEANPSAAPPAPPALAPSAPTPGPPQAALPTNRAKPLPGVLKGGILRIVGHLFLVEGTSEHPVSFESGMTRITARSISFNAEKHTIHAAGDVLFEYTHLARQAGPLESRNIPRHTQAPYANVTDTLRGNNFDYDVTAQQGHLDQAQVHVTGLDISADEVIINGQRYIIHNVILRPGGLTAAERKIYGTPPFNLRAKTIIITNSTTNNRRTARLSAIGGKLYYNNHALLSVPSYVLGNGRNLLHRERSAFTITPGISFNSADRALLTTRLSFAPSLDPQRLSLNADIGASARVGFRGGLSLDGNTGAGSTLR